jgi:hypothetical protein
MNPLENKNLQQGGGQPTKTLCSVVLNRLCHSVEETKKNKKLKKREKNTLEKYRRDGKSTISQRAKGFQR